MTASASELPIGRDNALASGHLVNLFHRSIPSVMQLLTMGTGCFLRKASRFKGDCL
jgi:hypothetical protein